MRARLTFFFVFLILFYAQLGCTPKVYPIKQLELQQPELASKQFVTADGIRLPLAVWENGDEAKAVIVAVHGFNDYRQAFKLPGSYLATQGIHFYAYDQRGFGETEYRGMWPGRDALQQDLITLVKLLKLRYPTVPLYLMGDSMGGAVTIATSVNAALPEIEGIILHAPAVWGNATFNRMHRIGLWLLAHTVPWMEVTGKGLKIQVTDNIPLLKELSKDPLMIRETRIDALYGMVHLMDYALDVAPEVDTPILLLYGLKDEIIPLQSVCQFVKRLNAEHQVIFYEQGYHFLMRDLIGEQVWQDISSWVLAEEAVATDTANEACVSAT